MAIPYLDPNPSRRTKDRRVAIISGVVAGIVMIIWSWMGTPQYAVRGAPAIEVVQELMPEEGAGHVREMGFENLLIGAFDTREEHNTGNEEMDHLLHEFAASIAAFDETDEDFNSAYGILTVTEIQANLKKIAWEIHWLNAEGVEENFARNFFLHRNSMYWEQYGLRDLSFFSLNGDGQE
jgi:hypothetical protein